MIDRDRIRSLAMAIRDHADLLEQYAIAPDVTPLLIEKEVLGRAYLIESRLTQLRLAVSLPDDLFTGTNTNLTLHVLGDRPTDDEAA